MLKLIGAFVLVILIGLFVVSMHGSILMFGAALAAESLGIGAAISFVDAILFALLAYAWRLATKSKITING